MEKKECYKSKYHAHFDNNRKSYVENPYNISKHNFFPFIMDQMNSTKITKIRDIEKDEDYNNILNGNIKIIKDKTYCKIKNKSRNIMFSSHMDRYVYQYYNMKLNNKYNIFAKQMNINENVVAYRNNLGKNNIHVARDVFSKIIKFGEAYVLIGDFTNFFDNIEHEYLKLMLKKLLKQDVLNEDYYAIYKNITRYSRFDINDLCNIYNMKKEEFYNTNKKLDFKILINNYKDKIYHNKTGIGIPQGSAISSSLSNIYMINADIELTNLVSKFNGIYKRYSDDFIIVLPNIKDINMYEIINDIKNILKQNGNLNLQIEKTKVYLYNNETIVNKDKEILFLEKNSKNELDYLGFSFDGKNIKIRDKSMSKFYHKMYKKIKTIAKQGGITKKGNKITMEEVYKLYSKKGSSNDKYGNFISYVERCEKIFKGMNFISFKKRFMSKLKVRYNKMKNKYKKL